MMSKDLWGPCYHNEDDASNPYDENINPEVYRVEDGHPFEVSPWPSMEDKCHLCGHPETMHMQATS